MWLDVVQEDLKVRGFRKWRQQSHNEDQLRAMAEEDKAHDRI